MINQNILNLLTAGNYREAARRLTKLLPRDVGGSVHYHLGLCYFFLGELERAHALVIQSIKAAPKNPDHFNALALVEEARGKFAEALSAIESAIPLAPEIPEFRNTKAKILLSLRREAEAIEILEPLVACHPAYAEAVLNLSSAYASLSRHTDLIALLNKIELLGLPDYRPYYWLAVAFSKTGEANGAARMLCLYIRKKYLHSYGARTSVVEAMSSGLEKLIAATPSYFETEDEIRAARYAFDNAILELKLLLTDAQINKADSKLVLDVFFKITNFYLAYQQLDDITPNASYAILVREYLTRIGIELERAPALRPSGPVRIGIISENFGLHITTWMLDWCEAIVREQGAELYVYRLNYAPGAGVLKHIQSYSNVSSYIVAEDTFQSAIEKIRADQLDLLFYPDVGMTASSRMLSFVRLARHQAVHWGHPITTGSPAMDYFITGSLMEGRDTARNYTERLIRLPALGAAFRREDELLTLIGAQEDELAGDHIQAYDFCSVQSLFKHLPQYDDWYLEILSLTGNTTLGFLYSNSDGSDQFFNRLRVKAETAKLDPQRVKAVPRRPHFHYLEQLKRVTVAIDAPGWSGGNTTLNCLCVGTPVVSIRMNRMRANHTAAMYQRMGLESLVPKTRSQYIELAVRLYEDKLFLQSTKEKIAERLEKLYQHQALNRGVCRLVKMLGE